MVMLKTPVRNVTVSTHQEDRFGGSTVTLGDRAQRSTSTQSATEAITPEVPVEEESEPVQDSTSVKQASSPSKEQQVKIEKPTNDAASGYEALFVRDTVPDSTLMSPNKVFRQTWTLYNPGPLAWPAGSDVRFVGGDAMFNVDTNHPLSLDSISAAMESNKLSEPLEPGQSANFTVTLKAPSRVGTAISYWRLKLPNGMPFGHRLWCDVQVRENAPTTEDLSELNTEGEDDSGRTESQMIFPKLDKESPEASIHGGGFVAPAAPSVSNPSEQDILEDVESLSLGDHDTETGFLTDEEYDILDASDQEYMDAKSRN
jgi:next-to-BRCA1 protein 1